jgi:hypothetical protein
MIVRGQNAAPGKQAYAFYRFSNPVANNFLLYRKRLIIRYLDG